MTAAVAVMSVSSTPSAMPKRHGFSIESLIGKPDSPPSSPRASPPHLPQLPQLPQLPLLPPLPTMAVVTSASVSPPTGVIFPAVTSRPPVIAPAKQSPHVTTPRPLPVRAGSKDSSHHSHRDSKSLREREALRDREILREREMRELRESESRAREREMELLHEREAREREMVIETMRGRERELREVRELRDRAEMATRERELREQRDSLEGRVGSNPFHPSPRSNSPPSPRMEKSVSPESENRLSAWGAAGEEFKHLLGGFPGGHIDSNGMYQPLRVCNRTLASINGMAGPPTGPLGVGMPPQFAHLPMNPFFGRDLPPQAHPLLAARYPGFMHHRYPMGPPPGLLFHPYRKPKRNRTAFSPSQLLQLEQAFEKNHYVVGQERKTLAAKLQLSETQVKVWFQNRRTKHKRMKAEEDGGSSGTPGESHSGISGKDDDGSDLTTYAEHDDDICTSDEEEELSVTEDV